jgi:hypothetical protein
MITSKQASLIGFAGLLGLVVATQQGCGSDTSGPTGSTAAGAPAAGAPAAGAPAGGAPAGGAPAGGAPAGGAPAAGAPAGGGGAGGGSAGAGGSSAGSGGTGGGSAGAGGGSAGSAGAGGGGAVTFAQIKTLFGMNCGVGMCHNAGSMHLNYQTGDLHALLTSPIPAGNKDCVGTTPVTANDQNSFLLKVVKTGGGGACPQGTGTIGRMPDMCSTSSTNPRACLTDTQIKLISDWIAAGAPS